MIGFNYKKAVQILNFFALKEGGSVNKMKALKLIWLADRDHLRKYGRPILSDRYYAMKLGPVPSSTKDLSQKGDAFLDDQERIYRDQFIVPSEDNLSIRSEQTLDADIFSETDLEILEKIYERFGTYNQFELAELTHEYPEWKRFEKSLEAGDASRFEMNYSEFFKNPEKLENDYFILDDEDLELSQWAFQENQKAMTI